METLPVRPSRAKSALGLAAFLGVTGGVAALGGRYPMGTRWYRRLRKPVFQPPGSVFGPVWGVLYALMAVSAWRVWRRPQSEARTAALRLWGVQLAVNSAWPWLFFGRQNPKAALADIGLLSMAINAYRRAARKVDVPAARMLAPYAGWVSYASVLNEEIVRLN